MSNSQFDAGYELLSKAIGSYSDPKTRSSAERVFDALGYKVDRVFDPYSDGGQAIAFSSKDGSKPPVIVFPGGDPGNPRSVGDEEFSTSKQAIQDWISSITNNQQTNPQGFKPDVTGASRGGSLSQLTASAFSTSIGSAVTFVSTGIDRATAAKFTENGGDPSQVRHYITDGDFRSLYGDAFIPGTVTVGTYNTAITPEVDYAERKHSSGILADFSTIFPNTGNLVTSKPADLTLTEISVDELNRADFTWQGQDWQVIVGKLQANNPNLAQLLDRQGIEEVRDHLGAGNVLNLVGRAVAGVYPVSSDRVNLPTAGDDVLFGTDDRDSIAGLAGDDYIRGGASDDIIFGNEGKDALIGGTGNDILAGGNGNDILTGGAGNDRFVFGDGTASLGIDRINDFTSGEDAIGLSETIFSLFKQDFAMVTDDASAATSTAAIVYNTSNGSLFYNTNGIDVGFGAGGQFASLFGQPTLSICDFQLV
jgi:serralysin